MCSTVFAALDRSRVQAAQTTFVTAVQDAVQVTQFGPFLCNSVQGHHIAHTRPQGEVEERAQAAERAVEHALHERAEQLQEVPAPYLPQLCAHLPAVLCPPSCRSLSNSQHSLSWSPLCLLLRHSSFFFTPVFSVRQARDQELQVIQVGYDSCWM